LAIRYFHESSYVRLEGGLAGAVPLSCGNTNMDIGISAIGIGGTFKRERITALNCPQGLWGCWLRTIVAPNGLELDNSIRDTAGFKTTEHNLFQSEISNSMLTELTLSREH
jgi:hypothetical protein